MIRTENLSFSYNDSDGKEKKVLNELSFHIKKGEFCAVLGHNGSGKSTLARLFNAILLPSGGRIYVNSMDTLDSSLLFNIRSTAGMVFQNPDNQMVTTIVEDEVAFAPENLGVEPEEIRRRVDEALALVGMTEFAKKMPSKLSGGQKQRIAIASVLAMEPECIILDEPTAMLDPAGRREVMETISLLNKKRHMTVILITHYMNEAALADRVIVMRSGEIALDGTPKEVFSQAELLKNIGLDVPQPTELAHRLSKKGLDIPADILTAEECANAVARLFADVKK